MIAFAVLVLAAACSDLPEAQVKLGGGGPQFVPEVADSIGDVGLGNAIATDADGHPFLSYFGFEPAAEGDTPAPARPIYSPSVPAVQLTTVADGIWSRGAVAQLSATPLVNIPFGPQELGSLKRLTPEDSNGTAIAVGDDDTKHMAWTADDGVWYAAATDTSAVERIYKVEGEAITDAGPVGRPSIAVDDAGAPWIAFSVTTPKAIEIHVASLAGDAWTDEVVAAAEPCSSCGQVGRTAIGVLNGAAVVAFVDPIGGAIRTVTNADGGWRESGSVSGDVLGGVSMASTGDTAFLAYYGDDAVSLASFDGGDWTSTKVADAPIDDAEPDTGNLAPSTGVAIDDQGTAYVAWQDALGVHLASGDGSTFDEQQTRGTDGGVTPAVAVAPDGSRVYVSWYDPEAQDLLMGTLGELDELAIANPSPIPPPSAAPSSGATECGADSQLVLDVAANGTAFDTSCLVGPAGQPFEIAFDDQDPVATAGAHNIGIYTEQGGDELFKGDPVEGPDSVVYSVKDPLDAGTYFFQCDFHPTIMTGTFAAIESGKGASGGGGSGAGQGSSSDAGSAGPGASGSSATP
jgi:hypothetical protein